MASGSVSGDHQNLHFVLLPWIGTTSHMIPMIDIGRALASRGATVTIVITPANAALLSPTISSVSDSSLPIQFVTIPFPSASAGLPEGCECGDSLPSFELFPNLYVASKLFRGPLEELLRKHPLPPSCLVCGMCYPWIPDLARELGVPCFIFHGFGAFALYCMHNLYTYKPHERAASATEAFEIPGLPFRFEITRQCLPMQFQMLPQFKEICEEAREGELQMDGAVINSVDELEPGYAGRLAEASGMRAFTIGPVSLFHQGGLDLAKRGKESSINASQCLQWLDSREPGSVIYVSFGTAGSLSSAQLLELGHGLLNAKWAFIWVINGAERLPSDVQRWLDEEFDKGGVESRCLLIRGWAPQVMILRHPAVGGFLTHCGWNSTSEGASAGVAMATWPLFAEQFLNQKLLVDVLGVGVAVGIKSPTTPKTAVEGLVSVSREEVAAAVKSLMGGGEAGEERRRRAKEFGEKVRKAVEKGGSSYENVTKLMEFVADNASRRSEDSEPLAS